VRHQQAPDFEPKLRIKGNSIVTYGQIANPNSRALSEAEKLLLIPTERPYSLFATKSRKRLKNSLTNWIDTVTLARSFLKSKDLKPISQHTFITLTLSSKQIHCDKILKRELLNKFLIQCSRDYNMKNFIWKAEVQGNGNLHYHILTEVYIPWRELRTKWNKIQDEFDYLADYKKKFNNTDPNSTDIHGLKKIKNVLAYVGKYMSKNEIGRPICGHTWGRSDSIAQLSPIIFTEDFQLSEWFNIQRDSLLPKESRGERWGWYGFNQKLNLNSLPTLHKRYMLSIIERNVEILTVKKN
jgi:hypothetical protein